MGSTLNDLSRILTGGGEQSAREAVQGGLAPAGTNDAAPGLNQLSDAAEKIAVKPGVDVAMAAAAAAAAAAAGQSQSLSQEQLIDVAQPMQFQQPSQPDIPPPVIPEQSQPVSLEDMKALLPTTAALAGFGSDNPMLMGQSLGLALPLNLEALAMTYGQYGLGSLGTPDDGVAAGSAGNRSKGKKQTRRGPMDEMRQLIRIMVKVFPHSVALIGNTEESGGGNRISEEQIKAYVEKVIGVEAPRPQWGVPSGWNGYLAELFSWATGKVITGEEASRVAKREPGRSWEAIEAELHNLGVHPAAWPLPLTLEGVREAEKNPVPLPVPAVASRRGGEDGTAPTSGAKRSRASAERDFSKMDEADIWKVIIDALGHAANKANTSADQTGVAVAKATAKSRMDELIGGQNLYPQFIPLGLNDGANILSLMQTIPGMNVNGQLDPSDPQTAAFLAAAAAAGMPAAIPAPEADAQAAKRVKREGEGTESTEEDEGSRPQAAMTSAEARGTLFGALGGTDPKADVAKAAGVAQLGSLPMQPPPLNLNNFAAAYLGQIPGLPNLTNMGPIPLGTPAGDPQMTTNPAPPAAPEGPAQ